MQSGFATEPPSKFFFSFAENSLHALSYRSEILGDVSHQLILRVATRNVSAQYQEIPVYCDKGVLNHGSQAEEELKEKQAQFDVIHVMKTLIADSPVTSAFQWGGRPLSYKKETEELCLSRNHD